MNERILIYLYIYQMMNSTDASTAAASLSNKQINERILFVYFSDDERTAQMRQLLLLL